ncbi:hypothetical protein ACFX2C_047104 [Malus domestica]
MTSLARCLSNKEMQPKSKQPRSMILNSSRSLPKCSPLIHFFFFVPGISSICHSKAGDVDAGFSTVMTTVRWRKLDVFFLEGWVRQTFSKFPHGRRMGEKFVGTG